LIVHAVFLSGETAFFFKIQFVYLPIAAFLLTDQITPLFKPGFSLLRTMQEYGIFQAETQYITWPSDPVKWEKTQRTEI
jgi:hypothetical protein